MGVNGREEGPAQTGRDASDLVRRLLAEAIERRRTDGTADDPLWGIIGLGAGPDDGITSENLDAFLYQAPGDH
jgi:hypothetical protein